ncbi:hypothetical protein GIB67_030625 [Kingdonia uniflora]|uniref:Reverse transcriptase zinc-binding domain-containing protein n=1 Tax=Kingdonia uniflora TaxID=39325 RepID=A0A7J7LM32_9MAGN|nr:hypothetical protein GIB67_030625 [Kingdonia uniflora]
MKLGWGIYTGNSEWGRFMKSKFYTRNGELINYYKRSTTCPAIKEVMIQMKEQIYWKIGNGRKVHILKDHWIGESALHTHTIGEYRLSTVSQLLHNNVWIIPAELQNVFEFLQINPNTLHTDSNKEDSGIWKQDIKCRFSVSIAYNWIREKRAKQWWVLWVWKTPLMPKIINFGWRLLSNAIPTDSELHKRGVTMVSRCYVCNNFKDLMQMGSNFSPLIKDLWKILVALKDSAVEGKAHMNNTTGDLQILVSLRVQCRFRNAPQVLSFYRIPPAAGIIRICCDGASLGNPGKGGCGVVYRDSQSSVIAVLVLNLPMTTSYNVECTAIVEGLYKALHQGFRENRDKLQCRGSLDKVLKWYRWIAMYPTLKKLVDGYLAALTDYDIIGASGFDWGTPIMTALYRGLDEVSVLRPGKVKKLINSFYAVLEYWFFEYCRVGMYLVKRYDRMEGHNQHRLATMGQVYEIETSRGKRCKNVEFPEGSIGVSPIRPWYALVRSRVISESEGWNFYDGRDYLVPGVDDYMTYWRLVHPNPKIGCTIVKRTGNIWSVGRDLVRPDVILPPTSSLATSSQVQDYSVQETDDLRDMGWLMDVAGPNNQRRRISIPVMQVPYPCPPTYNTDELWHQNQ